MSKLVRLTREFRQPHDNGDATIWPAGWSGEVDDKTAMLMVSEGAQVLSAPERIILVQGAGDAGAGSSGEGGNKYGGLSGAPQLPLA